MSFIKKFMKAFKGLMNANKSVNKLIKENPYEFKSHVLSVDPFQKEITTRHYVRRCNTEINKRRLK